MTSDPASPRRVLVLGGARSGKSQVAEDILVGAPAVDYVATGGEHPEDAEWRERVRRHQARRPGTWCTIATADLAPLLTKTSAVPLLVDSLTGWLTSQMDSCGAWWTSDGWRRRLDWAVGELLAAWSTTTRHVVVVSDEVGSGVIPESAAGRLFRDELGSLNVGIAKLCDEVWLVTAGVPWRLR